MRRWGIKLLVILILFGLGTGMAWAGHGPSAAVEQTVEHKTHDAHETVEAIPLTPAVSPRAMLPLLVVLIPMLAALGILLCQRNAALRNTFMLLGCGLSFLLLLGMFIPVVQGVQIGGHFYQGLSSRFSFLPGFPLTFKVDPAALVIALVTSFLWLVTSIYSIDYMKIEGKETRFAFFNLLTLAADLGVLLAGDFLTLFFFFEGLVIFPYALLAHREDEGALRGANNYLYLGALSGLSMIAGIMLLQYYTGSIEIRLLGEAARAQLPSNIKYWITGLMMAGFGVKAGIIPLHIWMPTAYPKAPNSACALSSGAMIKTGAYGIFRVVNMIFVPQVWDKLQQLSLQEIGYVVIWVGTVTMFLGVLGALISENSNRMLGFHSVSQMGYIVMGIGCAAYMGADGAMGLAGAIYHIVNHALFKASLFLCVGAVYFHTRELNMYKLGGLWRNMPVAAVGLFIAVCGISGIPGFNGFASKTVLHHAILEAYEYSAHLLGGVKDAKLKLVEIIFMVTAAGTFASNIKLFMLTFMGKRQEKHRDVAPAPRFIRWAIVMLSASIVLIGIFPNWILNNFIGPALKAFNFDPNSHSYHLLYNLHGAEARSLLPILYPVAGVSGNWPQVLHNLLGAGTAVLMGGMYFIPGMCFGWFHIKVPLKLQFEYHYTRIYRGFKWVCVHPLSAVAEMVNHFVPALLTDIWLPLSNSTSRFSALVDRLIFSLLTDMWLPLVKPISKLSAVVDELVSTMLTDTWLPLAKPISKLSEALGGVVEKMLPVKSEPLAEAPRLKGGAITQEEAASVPIPPHLLAEDFSMKPSSRFSFKFERPRPQKGPPWQTVAATIYLLFSNIAAKFDFNIIDGVVNGISRLAHGLSKISVLFDTEVIERIVNGTARAVDYSSNLFKRTQTGRIQNYLLAILLGMLAIITLYLLGILEIFGIY